MFIQVFIERTDGYHTGMVTVKLFVKKFSCQFYRHILMARFVEESNGLFCLVSSLLVIWVHLIFLQSLMVAEASGGNLPHAVPATPHLLPVRFPKSQPFHRERLPTRFRPRTPVVSLPGHVWFSSRIIFLSRCTVFSLQLS